MFETWFVVDLADPKQVRRTTTVFSQDSMANLIGVRVVNNGAPVELTGDVRGYALRSDDYTVVMIGEKENNAAWIVLESPAYYREGPIEISIKLETETTAQTLIQVVGTVVRTQSGTYVDPGTVIPNLEQLIADVVEATGAANEAAGAANDAATLANTKAGLADDAATLANNKAGLADDAATLANTKAGLADAAATAADAAADKLEDMDATATTLPAGAYATATVSTVDGHYNIAFGIPQGEKGDTGDPAPAADVANAVTSWLNTNVNPVGSAVVVDSSLSVSGAAADAAETGIIKSGLNGYITMPPSGHTIIQGSYNSSGAVVSNAARIRVSGFVEVKKGEIIKFTAGTKTTGILVGTFNASKVYQSETWYADGAEIKISNDGYVILVFRKDTSNTSITPSEYDAVTQLIPVWKSEVKRIEDEFDGIAELKTSVNRLDPNSNIQNGYYNPNGGAYSTSTSYKVTDFIPVEPGKYAIISNSDNEFVQCRFIAEYDINKNIINFNSNEGQGNGKHYFSSYVLASQNAGYIRPAYAIGQDNTKLMVSVSDSNSVPEFAPYFAPHYSAKDSFVADHLRAAIDIYAEDGIDKFYESMKTAYEKGNTDVTIHKGTYMYTNALIDAIREEVKRGVPIGNGCRYFFETGAVLVCEYTGENTADVASMFSALDSQNAAGDYEIYNLDLTAKNILYAIHDEANGYNAFYSHKYKNCYVTLNNTALGSASDYKSRCIGGGLGKHGEIIIEDCVFNCTNPGKETVAEQPVAYHGANGSTFSDVKFIVTGCYFNGLFRGSNLTENTEAPYPRIIYSNNLHQSDPSIAETWTKYVFNNSTY